MKKHEWQQENIYKAAAKLFYHKGYSDTSMRELATAVGLEPGSLYYYYKSKSKLLYAIMKNGIQNLIDSVEAALKSTDNTTEKLNAALTIHMSHFLDRKEETGLAHEMRNLNPKQRARLIKMNLAYVEKFRLLLELGVTQGVFRPCNTRLVTPLILSNAMNIGRWYIPDNPSAVNKVVNTYVDLIMYSLLQKA